MNTQPHNQPHVHLLALTLALAYLLVIVYASLQPLRGWRMPAAEVYGFLTAPWPPYITLADVLVNVAAYVPLGFMLALGLRIAMPPVVAVALALLLSVVMSIAMEAVQMFLPARIASNVDVLANGAGALIGALAAPLFLPSQRLGAQLGAWRNRVFVPGVVIDAGVVVAVLWVITQLNPLTQVFGTGHLRGTFDLPAYVFHTPSLLLSAEATVVMFNLLGIGLLLSTLLRAESRHGPVIAAVITAALGCKMLITVFLAKPQGAWAWMTPGVLLGFILGAIMLAGLLSLGQAARLALALLALLLALAAINLAPDNPYFSLPPQLASGRSSHFLSFSNILQALSELWPLIALGYLGAALWHTRTRSRAQPSALTL
jgi:VanZ family protein